MPGVYEYLLKALAERYNLRWVTIQANNVGSPQVRARVFMWCVRKDIAATQGMELQFVPELTRSDLETLVQKPWNGAEPGVDGRMLMSSTPGSTARLTMLGNIARALSPSLLLSPHTPLTSAFTSFRSCRNKGALPFACLRGGARLGSD